MSKHLALLVAAAAIMNPARGATIAITNTFEASQTTPAGVGGTVPAVVTVANLVHALGIQFRFTQKDAASNDVLSDAASYGNEMFTTANQLAPLSDPVLDGSTDGILTLNFDAPSTFLSFDLVIGWPEDLDVQVTVGGISQEVTKVFTTTGDSGFSGVFSIGSILWSPGSPFTKAVITFDGRAAQVQADFAIDNLSYDLDLAAAQVPEPASLIAFGSGALLLGLLAGLRQFRTSGASR